jgi:PAS domain S-box-containing protein
MKSSDDERGFFAYHWPTVLVFVLGLVISIGLWQSVSYYEQRHLRDQFRNRTQVWVEQFRTKFNDSVNTLRSVRNLFHANQRVTAREFDRFTEPVLSRQHQMITIEWLPKVTAGTRERFRDFLSERRDEQVEIWTTGDTQSRDLDDPAMGSFYPVKYIEQRGGDPGALTGFGHATIEERRTAMERARDRGRTVVSRIHSLSHYGELVDLSGEDTGYYIFIPLFRQPDPMVQNLGSSDREHLGFVAGGFSVPNQVSGSYDAEVQTIFDIVFYEKNRNGERRRFYSTIKRPDSSTTADLTVSSELELPGTSWFLEFRPTDRFMENNHSNTPWLVLILALLTTGGASYMSFRFTRRVREAELERLRTEKFSRTMIDEVEKYSICFLDTQGRVKTWNEGAHEIEGYEANEVIGETLEVFLPDSDREAIDPDQLLEEARAEGRAENEGWRKRKGGDHYWANEIISTMKDDQGSLIGFIRIVRDRTERMSREQELKEAKEAAEEANRAKSDFLAKMSHELRTPLTSIIGYSEMLQEDAEREDIGETFREDLERIESSGRHLLNLINEILDLSKIEAGKMDVSAETFSVEELVREVETNTRPIADENNNEFITDVDSTVGALSSDRTKVHQCLVNLLSNACKFTEEGTVSLRAFPDELNGTEAVTFEVEDTGIGISEDERKELFEAFEQIEETSTREFEGTGLGLTITKRFTDMLHGRLEVESEEGEGSLFRLTVPQFEDEESPDDPLEADSYDVEDAEGPVALVIDDNDQVRNIISRTLEQDGFSTLLASSGEEGIELAREYQPDVITLDVIMPSKDGWSVINELKSNEQTADIPVIMVTIMEDEELGYSLGAEDFLVKPIDRDRLVETVSSTVSETSDAPVLIVEDNEDDREMFRRMLSEEDYDVVTAGDGAEGLEQFVEHEPQAIFLDLMMPKMDGFEFLNQLRSDHDDDVPVIVVTAKSLTPSEIDQLEERVEATMSKSAINREELLGKLRDRVGESVE